MGLSYSEVADILKIIDGSSCDEVILEQDGVKLVIRRGAQGQPQHAASPSAPQTSKSPALEKGAQDAPRPPTSVQPQDNTICSPMVGTFYARPSPDEPPFVQAGSTISPGTPLCVIEVMKLFTTVEATRDGTIRDVLVEDGQLVEFDQPIFLLD